jgi:hypothetical protein
VAPDGSFPGWSRLRAPPPQGELVAERCRRRSKAGRCNTASGRCSRGVLGTSLSPTEAAGKLSACWKGVSDRRNVRPTRAAACKEAVGGALLCAEEEEGRGCTVVRSADGLLCLDRLGLRLSDRVG